MQNLEDPVGTSAIVAAGIFSSMALLLKECARMHVLLLAVLPRGERCAFERHMI
jgi:hypothetical protein